MFVGVCVCYRSLHCWGCGAEIWHGTGVPPEKVLANVQAAPPAAEAKECFWRSVQPEPTVRFREAALTRQKTRQLIFQNLKLNIRMTPISVIILKLSQAMPGI